ncbi:LysR family transcriptional regulator [Achromobacter aloeverae]|uniref:LysR family transcriptional regulator n=1 Tax=Achromobacter aloeverae TaxID=1750518 RepID=A0A4Q1HGF9_9BURK|nr:LysR family transcriptional regulator [Achromobacter aloeverae]RXN86182.1 LysR family transcriptional regulator [Achromobacter aloeverae]
MNISGRLLDAFIALAETGKFAVAAQRCNVSASAFSQSIARLEELVGARLFDRDTRNVSLTSEGQIFLVGARRMQTELQASLSAIRNQALLNEGQVAIAAPPSLCSDWLPRLLAAFRRDHPGIVLRVHDAISEQSLDLIAAGDVDFALNAVPGSDLEFESALLFNEPFHLLCHRDDPVARRRSIALKDLAGRVAVQTTRFGSVWHYTRPLLAAAGIRDSGLEVAQFGSLAGLVAAGFGISIVPRFALALCSRPELAAVPISDPGAYRPIYRIRQRGRSLSAAAEAMWKRIGAAPLPGR